MLNNNNTDKSSLKYVRLDITKDFHKLIKIGAAYSGLTIQEFVISAIKQELNKYNFKFKEVKNG
jgi:uncharacterized protein (DUF1778 family)